MQVKTVKGYLSAINRLDDAVVELKGFDKLTDYEQDALTDLRAAIAEVVDTFKD